MELRHLTYFVAVAEELHFGRAAARVGIAQPPLSQQIRRLEEELGVQLFQRSHRRVSLTGAGRVLLEEARRTLEQARRAVLATQRAGRGEEGRLAIGFISSAPYSVLPEILRKYHQRYPDVQLSLHELATDAQVRSLNEQRLDVGLVRPPGDLDDLEVLPLLREPLVVALPRGHRLSHRRGIALSELAGEGFIVIPRRLGAAYYDQIVEYCGRAGFSPDIAQEAELMQTVVSLVAAGLGVSLVPASLRRLVRAGVVYRPLHRPVPTVELAAIWSPRAVSATLTRFLEVAREVAAGPSV
jgi:DNA-binding transcriptional LysR family regulator